MTAELEVPRAPEVAIILPVFDDAEWVANALDSCRAQSLADIEIIVVDDASTDDTVAIVEDYQAQDSRIRLIRQSQNLSAFQARRAGIEASTAPYLLFLDGDDELLPTAAETAISLARSESADVVGFACQVTKPDGSTGGAFESSMKPRHPELTGEDITTALFPVGKTAQGQLWRYLFERSLLTNAYASLPADLVVPRANDLPIAFLALMRAHRYVSTQDALYRYFFRRGASGHRVTTIEQYEFIASAINSIESIADAVTTEARSRTDSQPLLSAYESARLSVTGSVLKYVSEIDDPEIQSASLALLRARVGSQSLIAASADFSPNALSVLAVNPSPPSLKARDPRHIVVRASNLGTGGAQGVVIAQARHLANAGFAVTIAVDSAPDTHFPVPPNVRVIQLTGASTAQKLATFVDFCKGNFVDVVIDHYVLYNTRWPYFALAAAEEGIPTIGWVHNFALRPIIDGTTRLTYLDQYLPLLSSVVALSEADVAYWKLRGLSNVVYLPNPASPLLERLASDQVERTAPTGTLEIVWWGRLQQTTKQVRDLILIGSALRDLDVDFRLTIIGPDGPDLKAKQLHELACTHGIDDLVDLRGPLHGDELIAAIEHAHVFVSTSVIEGYPLAFVEAQAVGLPLVMYDLPWLATLQGNAGVIAVPQSDVGAAARALAMLATDSATYEKYSSGALAAAGRALSHDFESLYRDLVRGVLGAEHSPEPGLENIRLLLDHNTAFLARYIGRQQRALTRARDEEKKQRARADRLSKQLGVARAKVAVHGRVVSDARRVSGKVPSVPRTGLRGFLLRLLPSTMKQAGFYARHQHNMSARAYEQILKNQGAVNDHLGQVAADLAAAQRQTQEDLCEVMDQLSAISTGLASVEQRFTPLEEQLQRLDTSE